MEENIAELSRKYREEMMRMYGAKQTSVPAAQAEPAVQTEAPSVMASVPEPEAVPASAEVIPEENVQPQLLEETIPEQLPEEEEGFEDPILPEYIQPSPPTMPEDWMAQEAYEKRNTAEGRLRVIASTARSAYPVAGARVMVYTRIGGKDYLNYVLTTDISGETPIVTLPAPPASLSQDPENEVPYAVCDIEIYATGFFHSEARNVHIFAGVTTRQEFQLIPLPLHFTDADQIAFHHNGPTEEVS